jgi:hypothetical protein
MKVLILNRTSLLSIVTIGDDMAYQKLLIQQPRWLSVGRV